MIKLNKQLTFIMDLLIDSRSVFGKQIRHKISDGFPIQEGTDFDYITKQLVKSFNGEGICKNWRNINNIDQIKDLVEKLKSGEKSISISSYDNSSEHQGFQILTRNLSLDERLFIANKRYKYFDPCDFGIPAKVTHDIIDKLYPVPRKGITLIFTISSTNIMNIPFCVTFYSLLLEIIGKMSDMAPDEIIGNIGEIYNENQSDNFERFHFYRIEHLKSEEFYKLLSEDISLFSNIDSCDFKYKPY